MAIGERSQTRRPAQRSAPDKLSHVCETEAAQLSLFDAPPDHEGAKSGEAANDREAQSASSTLPADVCADVQAEATTADQEAISILHVSEMPTYSDEAHDAVLLTMKLLPSAQVWFTYKDVRFFFGISRATVARRLRERVVPGVRMAGSSVLEDTTVRRFDRDQLKWLLLAVRHRARRPGQS